MQDSTSRVLAAVRGAGSLLDLASSTPHENLVPSESFNDRLRVSFERVGSVMRQAINAEGKFDEASKPADTSIANGGRPSEFAT